MYFFQCPHKFHPPDSLNNAPFSSSSSSSLLTPSSRVSCRNRRPTPPLAPLLKKKNQNACLEKNVLCAHAAVGGEDKRAPRLTQECLFGDVYFFLPVQAASLWTVEPESSGAGQGRRDTGAFFLHFLLSHRLCCRLPSLMQDVFQDSFFPPIILLLLSGALSAGYRTRWCSQRRELVLSAVAAAALPLPLRLRWFSLRGLWSLFYVSWCWLPVFPPPLFGGLKGGLASLYAYLCIRVCVRRWKDEEIVRRNWKDRKSVPLSFFSLLFPARSCATAPSARITKTHVCRLCFQAVKPKKPSLCRRPPAHDPPPLPPPFSFLVMMTWQQKQAPSVKSCRGKKALGGMAKTLCP